MVVGDLATTTDVLVLGAGPGGYVAAIRAAQLGKEVILVDPGPPGGTCLHQGCIPAKALLAAVDQAWQLRGLAELGISVGETAVEWSQMQQWKSGVIDRLAKGVKQLLGHHKVEIVQGTGWFLNEQEARVEAEYGAKRFMFEHAIIAVGADPAPLPDLPFDGERILTPTQALNLAQHPEHLVVFGSDYIAVELATLFAKLGVPTQLLLPAGQRLLPEFDPAAGRLVQARLKKLGVKLETEVEEPGKITGSNGPVVISRGVVPRTAGLHLSDAQVKCEANGAIPVNDRLQTSNPAIYAVGDVTGGPPLAHLAIKQGKVAAESLAGRLAQYAPQAVPRVAWTDPQVASVGLTATEAEAAGYEIITGRFPMGANGRALTLNAGEGFVLTVAERKEEVLLGVTIVGPGAETLISAATLALEMGATLTDLIETLQPHPSLGETLLESAEAALGLAVHIK
jgi:dihydrolipoamide dehydrogenase